MSLIKNLISKLRKGSKRLYRSGWQNEVSEPVEMSNPRIIMNNRIASIAQTETTSSAVEFDYNSKQSAEYKDTRIEKKPVEVVKDIVIDHPTMDMTDLDKQIRVVSRRRKVLREEAGVQNTRDEDLALAFLKARKKFKKYGGLFRWAVTSHQKVSELCGKYKLRQVNFQSFYKNVPAEAIDELEKFTQASRKVTDAEPALLLIIDDGGKEDKKDPILLATSPFGNWMYILGAWDREVEYVDDLIYKGK